MDFPEGMEDTVQDYGGQPPKTKAAAVTYASVGVQMLRQYQLAAQDGRTMFQLPAIGGELASVIIILAADCVFQETSGSLTMSKDRYYHVYAVPVQLKEETVSMAVLCECSAMEAAWRTLRGHNLLGCSVEGELTRAVLSRVSVG
jgi:hypothetical protein